MWWLVNVFHLLENGADPNKPFEREGRSHSISSVTSGLGRSILFSRSCMDVARSECSGEILIT